MLCVHVLYELAHSKGPWTSQRVDNQIAFRQLSFSSAVNFNVGLTCEREMENLFLWLLTPSHNFLENAQHKFPLDDMKKYR